MSLVASAPSYADNPLIDEVTPFGQALLAQLRAKKFSELERLEAELHSSKARFIGGDWKLFHFYETMSGKLLPTKVSIESDWQELIGLHKEWQAASPTSHVPSILLANTYAWYAWEARGTARAEKTSQYKFDRFTDRLNQAAFFLNQSRRLSTRDPHWFTVALMVARGLGWDKSRAYTLFNEAVEFEPLYQHSYSQMAIYLLPRWYGDEGEWETFSLEATGRVGGPQGSAIYHHIIVRASMSHTLKEFFADNDLSWPRIQAAFAERERLHGEGKEAVNAMCWLAIATDDVPVARRFMSRIGDSWAESVWSTRQRFDSYQRWLNGSGQ